MYCSIMAGASTTSDAFNAEAIRPLREWAETFERYWQHQLHRIKESAEATVREGSPALISSDPHS
jgi:hypothetical protein